MYEVQHALYSPTLTVDVVVFQLLGDELVVLLTQRSDDPFRGEWALPGLQRCG